MSKSLSIIFVLLLILAACTSTPKQPTARIKAFTVPQPPAILTSPEQKAEFVATHYWDNFAFADTMLIGNTDITEQAFADFVNMLPYLSPQLLEKGVSTMMSKAAADSAMYAHFIELSEKYLYDPNSPFRNEEIYIVVLRNIVGNEKLDDIYKVRPQYQLALALKNRVGDKATDFTYTTTTGAKKRLHEAKGNYILLFFFEPDCPDCKRVKEYIVDNHIAERATIVMVNPDEVSDIETIYDVRARPLLYLLDKDKKVLLKDVSIEQIEQYLTAQ